MMENQDTGITLIRNDIKYTFLFTQFLQSLFATDTSIIIWERDCHLRVQDFKLPPPEEKKKIHHAEGYCGIAVNFSGDDDFLEYRVYAFFNKDSSWIRDTTFSTAYIQLHFNISEKYARLLRKELTLISTPKKSVFESLIKEKISQIHVLMKKEQAILDIETGTGSDVKKQKKWYMKVKNELDFLEEYENNKTKIVEF